MAFKRVDFAGGCSAQFPYKRYFNPAVGIPFGGFFNVHYASGNPKATFRFTFDFLFSHLNSQTVARDVSGTNYYTNRPMVYIFRINDFRGSFGPGFQVRLIENCTLRFGALFMAYQALYNKLKTIDFDGSENEAVLSTRQFLFPGDRYTLNLKLGVNYVFQY